MTTTTEQFSALGTTIEGGLRGDRVAVQKLWAEVRQAIIDFERRFSRFDRRSELSHLNARSGGQPQIVSPEMLRLLKAARDVYSLTDGIVDVTIGQALINAGYDTSFDLIVDRPIVQPGDMELVRANFSLVEIDEISRRVTIPERTSLDFGGIGKGYLLDQLRAMIEPVTTNYWLSLGGDLLVSGTDTRGKTWSTRVQHPLRLDHDHAEIIPATGRWGIATSGITKRRGVRQGKTWHHIIDPRTGKPSDTDVLSATVVATTALQADVYAKTVVIKGAELGLQWLQSIPSTAGLVVTVDEQLRTTPEIEPLLKRL